MCARPFIPGHAVPGVDWDSIRWQQKGKHRARYVKLICIECDAIRWQVACVVKHSIKVGSFTGYCRHCTGRSRKDDFRACPPHPAVNWQDSHDAIKASGIIMTKVLITCPDCRRARYLDAPSVKCLVRKGAFTGRCTGCAHALIHPALRKSVDGYLLLKRRIIAPKYHWIYDSMADSAYRCPAHRLIMAVHLNRPLTRDEIVHHKDGRKLNNALSNLQLFIKGHHSGHGSYYQKWQEALTEIKRLRIELQQLTKESLQKDGNLIEFFDSFHQAVQDSIGQD